ncbi:NAD-dependent deacylase [Martelella alba]|uniref:NAD-dependent protein deacylase n=1 Tax=Martelella alba TaxID=2590451 RepID=A0A506UGV3_9HYPH|nr:NAD-dependent deacylase [Martelella alba]TPW32549.1 NAD-dependent deacylase [Martelella alba]
MKIPKTAPLIVLTGAGISAGSGLATFRGSGGLWAGHDINEVATPEGFQRDPELVHDFYNMRRCESANALPNAAHRALAALESSWEGPFLLVTQNVDDLHEKAGSRRLIHMHGSLNSVLCLACGRRSEWHDDTDSHIPCPHCGRPALRPDIVWFGEMPYHMEEIGAALEQAGLFLSVGTSGTVYPAAGFVAYAKEQGAKTVEINLEDTHNPLFDRHISGDATQTLPAFVHSLLSEADRGGSV